MTSELLLDGPSDSRDVVVLAHGAGGPMDSPFMNRVAGGLAEHGIRVARFEFPYMGARRTGGRRVAPDRPQVLLESWKEAVASLGGGPSLVIGGKSLGGRIASMVADEVGARGLVCLGYPFHPPGKPEQLRTKHLESLTTPALFIQGTRDPFGSAEEVVSYHLSSQIRMHWIEAGDHSYKPPARSGRTEAVNVSEAIAAAAEFVLNLGPPTARTLVMKKTEIDNSPRVQKSEEEWRRILTPEQYHVLREKGTERAFTGEYAHTKDKGTYLCSGCGNPLFDSETKFDSGTGWPSFSQPLSDDSVDTEADRRFFMTRTEVNCKHCGGHLGHVFDDGPKPTGQRYCMNSAALKLKQPE
jgi:methionine-R-sulfoxide reductase